MKSNGVLKKLMTHPAVSGLGLKEEAVVSILRAYSDIAFDTLLSNGSIDLGNGITINIVQLLDRVHVLRGVSYQSSRKYKLKIVMEESIYTKIEEYYDRLREEIL